MKTDEYEIMFRVEDHHWWYVGLRGVLDLYWRRYLHTDHPTVLDVGCGTGATLDALPDVAVATGIDAAPEAIRLCRMRELARSATASAESLPFSDCLFDAAVSFDVLCHRSIADKNIPLREIHRVLKSGGLLFLNLPAYQWLHSSHDTHVYTDRRFTRDETCRILDATGFEVMQATYWNTVLFPPILAVRLWRKAFPLPASDLDEVRPSPLSSIYRVCLALERAILPYTSLPYGLSIFAVARKR